MELLPISTPHCRVERDGHVVIVTMDRPEARNALSSDMLVGLAEAWAYVSAEPEVRVGILTGANGTFCAGRRPQGHGHPVDRPPGAGGAPRRSPTSTGRACSRRGRCPPSRSSARSRATRSPAAPSCSSAPTCAWSPSRPRSACSRPAARCSRWAAARSGSPARSPTATPWTCCSPAAPSPPRRPCPWGWSTGSSRTAQALAAARELADDIAASGPLAVQAILRTYRETLGLPEPEALKVSDAHRLAGDRLRGRQGGRPRLHRKAPRHLSRPVTRGPPARGICDHCGARAATAADARYGRCG